MTNDKPQISKIPSGYTLIEILVALTILGVIFNYGFISFRDFSRRQAVMSAKRILEGDVRYAQEQASSGRKPDDAADSCGTTQRLNGYNFNVTSSTTYSIEAVCTGGVVEVKTSSLSGGIQISTPSPNPIFFKILGQGNNIDSDVVITISQLGTSNTLDLTVTSGGEVK